MNNQTIFNKAEDSSWIVIAPGEYRKLLINPNQISIVKKWSLEDKVEVTAKKYHKPFHFEIKNLKLNESVSAQ